MNNIGRGTLFLAGLMLAAASFAASPEYLVGATLSTPAPGLRGSAATASDGTDFFSVWADGRSPMASRIIGTRVTRLGRVLDPLGIRIDSFGLVMSPPLVVWDGEAYVVVWRARLRDQVSTTNILAARVGRDGHVITEPRAIADTTEAPMDLAIASNGDRTVVAFSAYSTLSPAGIVVLDRQANVIHRESPSMERSSHLSLIATASGFVLSWDIITGTPARSEIRAVALNADGHVDGEPVTIGTGFDSAIGTDGTRLLSTSWRWIASEPARPVLFATPLNADLSPAAPDVMLTPAFVDGGWRTTILWREGHYEVLTAARVYPSSDWRIHSFDVGVAGGVIASRQRGAPISRLQLSPDARAVTNGSEVFIAFRAAVEDSTSLQAFGAVYSGSAAFPDAQHVLSWSGNGHANPVIAASPHGQLVAWDEESGVYATRIDAHGRSLDGRGVLLAEAAFSVRLAFDGTNYVAAWLDRDQETIFVRRISAASGATLAETHVDSRSGTGLAIAASTDATYVVHRSSGLAVIRIPHATAVPDPIALDVSDQYGIDVPVASWNGSELLVAWNEVRPEHWDPSQVRGLTTLAVRVTDDLTLLDPQPIVIGAIGAQSSASLGPPSIASDGTDWLILTSLDHTYGNTEDLSDIVVRRLRHDGTLDPSTTIAEGDAPAIVWEGTRYAVAWKVGTSVRFGTLPADGSLADIRGVPVAPDSAPSRLSLAPASNGVAVAYTRVSDRPEHAGVERTFLRFMDSTRGRVVRR